NLTRGSHSLGVAKPIHDRTNKTMTGMYQAVMKARLRHTMSHRGRRAMGSTFVRLRIRRTAPYPPRYLVSTEYAVVAASGTDLLCCRVPGVRTGRALSFGLIRRRSEPFTGVRVNRLERGGERPRTMPNGVMTRTNRTRKRVCPP